MGGFKNWLLCQSVAGTMWETTSQMCACDFVDRVCFTIILCFDNHTVIKKLYCTFFKYVLKSLHVYPCYGKFRCTLGKQNNCFTSAWHCTGEPTPQVRTQQSTYILRTRDTHLNTGMYTEKTEVIYTKPE